MSTDTQAQHSVVVCQIIQRLNDSKTHADYAVELRRQALAMLPEAFPIGSIVVADNGTLNVVTGHKDDNLSVCNVGLPNSGWTHWRNVKYRTP